MSSGGADTATAQLRFAILRAVGEDIAQASGGPYTEAELSHARQLLPSSSPDR